MSAVPEESLWSKLWEAHRGEAPPSSVYGLDPFRIVERRFNRRFIPITESLFALSNGYLGVRGVAEEAHPVHQRATLVNGFHETWPIVYGEEAFGFAKTGQTIMPVPDATQMRLYVEDEPFDAGRAEIHSWERTLCMKTGTLTREVVWETATGKRFRVTSRRLVSLEHRHLVLIDYTVEPLDQPALLTIASELANLHGGDGDGEQRDPRRSPRLDGSVLELVDRSIGDERCQLAFRTRNSNMHVAAGMQHRIEADCTWETQFEPDDDRVRFLLLAQSDVGSPVRITKFVGYHTSDRSDAQELSFRVDQTLDQAMFHGTDAVFGAQERRMTEFWNGADVQIDGAPELQQAVRFNLFHVFQASARAAGHGIPAKGLTGTGYEGHYFWDADIYVMPMLIRTDPKAAENYLRFRGRLLPAARRRAAELSNRGVLYPWRTINGEEASAYYASGTAQYHINADIAYALQKYVRATGDIDLLADFGAEILIETARFWMDLGFFSDRYDGQFCIMGVTGPDEYTTVVDNNLYTNLMARDNLRAAADAVERLEELRPDDYEVLAAKTALDPGEVAAWRRAGARMYVPYDAAAQVHLQDDAFLDRQVWDFAGTPPEKYPLLLHFHPLKIYRHQVIKQADVVMATFLLGWNFTYAEKRSVFEYYDPLTTNDSSLSAPIQSIMAAELGKMDTACEYFADSVLIDLLDFAGNTADGVHVASAGGVWMALVYGFGGLRDHGVTLRFRPAIPDGWDRLSFRLAHRGGLLVVSITPDETTYRLDDGSSCTIYHWDQMLTIEPGREVVVANPSHGAVPEPAEAQTDEPPEFAV